MSGGLSVALCGGDRDWGAAPPSVERTLVAEPGGVADLSQQGGGGDHTDAGLIEHSHLDQSCEISQWIGVFVGIEFPGGCGYS